MGRLRQSGGPLDCQIFVTGLNAWIDLTERRPALRPPEFDCFETQPARWQAGDIVRIRSHARVNNLLSEEARARVLAEAEPCIDLARKALHPDCVPMIPKGVAFGEIPADVLDVFRLATTGINLTPTRLAASSDNAWKWSKVGEFGEVGELEGSNNWVVSAQRTATGRPILANDPHRSHTLPALRYVAHITAPGLDIIGAGEPALPGVSIGHNGCAAFGMTIFPMDQEDLFVYETDPHDPNRYGYGGGWETMRIEHERIPVRCCSAQDVLLKFTRHGPVVYRRYCQPSRIRRADGLVRAWKLALFCEPRLSRRKDAERLRWSAAPLVSAIGQPGLCRRQWQYRLVCRRKIAPSTELGWIAPGARGWAL